MMGLVKGYLFLTQGAKMKGNEGPKAQIFISGPFFGLNRWLKNAIFSTFSKKNYFGLKTDMESENDASAPKNVSSRSSYFSSML